MKKFTLFFLVLPAIYMAAIVNLNFSVGNPGGLGLSFLPEIEFWKVKAKLHFDLSLNAKDNMLVLNTFLSKPEESLRDLSVIFDSAGLRYGVTEPFLLQFTNVNFSEHALSAWVFDGVIGGYFDKNYILFFKLNFFALSIGSDGSYHLAVPIKLANFSVAPFVSSKGNGVSFEYSNFQLLAILEKGLRISFGQRDFVFFSEYLENNFNIGISWVGNQEWFTLTNNGMSFRKKIGEFALICKLEREEWYAGFSFPIFW